MKKPFKINGIELIKKRVSYKVDARSICEGCYFHNMEGVLCSLPSSLPKEKSCIGGEGLNTRFYIFVLKFRHEK